MAFSFFSFSQARQTFQPNPWLHVVIRALVPASHKTLSIFDSWQKLNYHMAVPDWKPRGFVVSTLTALCPCSGLARKDVYVVSEPRYIFLCYLIYCSICLGHRDYIKIQYVTLTRRNSLISFFWTLKVITIKYNLIT